MKNSLRRWGGSISLASFLCITVCFCACNSYNFSSPQPVDKKNITEFPAELRGTWYVKDESEKDHYFIDRKFVLLIMNHTEKIVKGAWPKLDAKGEYVYLPGGYNSYQTINYDTLKRPTDTVNNYLLRGGFIYEVDSDKYLKKSYTYLTQGDTIVANRIDTVCVDLGQNAFLRLVSRDLYALNMRNSILGEDAKDFGDWWKLMLLEKKPDHSVSIWECTSKTGDLPGMFYAGASKGNIFYFDCQWTSTDLLRLMKEGYFEVTSEISKNKFEKDKW